MVTKTNFVQKYINKFRIQSSKFRKQVTGVRKQGTCFVGGT